MPRRFLQQPNLSLPLLRNLKFQIPNLMELKFILESLLFSAQKPLSVKELRDVLASAAEHEDADATAKSLAKTRESDLTAALEQLAREHETAARSYRLPGGARAGAIGTQPGIFPWP